MSSKAPVSRSMVLAIFVIAVVSLALATYALVAPLLAPRPRAQDRTFLISIDWLNVTSGLSSPSARFTPDTLGAVEGDFITLSVTNRDPRAAPTGQHGFTVDGANLVTTIDPGDTFTIDLQVRGAGVYRYYCQLHETHLAGQIIIVEP